MQLLDFTGSGARDLKTQRRRLVSGELIEYAGNLERDAGPHQHDTDSGEHRPVERCERR